VCAFGFTFLLEAIFGFSLLAMAMAALLKLQKSFPYTHWSRKSMFFLLMTTGALRGVLNAVACRNVMAVKKLANLVVPPQWLSLVNLVLSVLDTQLADQTGILKWFLETTLPINAISDLIVAFADFTITSFWLDVLFHRVMRKPFAIAIQAFAGIVLVGVFGFLVRRDYRLVIDEGNYNTVYEGTLAVLSSVLILFGLLHVTVACFVLRSMYCMKSVRSVTLLQSARLRATLLVMAVTGLTSAVCLLFRGLALVGRLARIPIFFDGALSLANPVFTTIYFVVLMNIPCLAVMGAFGSLTFKFNVADDCEMHPLEELSDARDLLAAAYDQEKTLNLFVEHERSKVGTGR
jgi:hypothetical protein